MRDELDAEKIWEEAMDFLLRFAYPLVLYAGIPLLLVIAWLRVKMAREIRYTYSLAAELKKHKMVSTHPYKKILYFFRFLSLLLMILLIAKPQWVDPRSKVTVEGVDIVLVLDISGSMNMPHHSQDNRSRIAVAKEEAIRFVQKRTNDAIGVVVFGNDALSRCPLTVDKMILETVLSEVEIGLVNPEGTVVAQSVLTAANRLRHSKAKSKIMILLTDGEPSENDISPEVAIQAAKQLGIKIYTIGIGDDQEILIRHPLFGVVPMKTTLNKPLLNAFARETGGTFFEAKHAHEMRAVYDTIDKLEKTEIESPIFNTYHDWFIPLLLLVAAIIIGELFMKTFIWFGMYI